MILLAFGGLLSLSHLIAGAQRKTPQVQHIRCANNLRQIGLGIQMYAAENQGRLPDSWQTLFLNEDLVPENFVCPATDGVAATGATKPQQAAKLPNSEHCSYFYLGAAALGQLAWNSPESANAVLAYELPANHHGYINVLFGDIHVEALPPAAARQLLGLIATGVRPVIWPPPPATQPATGS